MSTHTDALGHARHTAGTVGGKGGQFATKTNDAPLGSLEDLAVDAPKRSSELTTEAIRQSQQIMERTAVQMTRSFRIDQSNADDIVQDAWVLLLERDQRRGDIADRTSERAFLNLTTRNRANHYGNDRRFGLRSEEFAARRQLRALADTFHADNGRRMTPNEYAAAAAEVRMSFPAGARPKDDFYREISQLSLNVTISDTGETTLGDTLIGDVNERDSWDEQEDAAALALHTFENKQATKADVTKDMWRILSLRIDGAPQPVAESVDPTAVKAYRRTVKAFGGAHKLGLAWLDGESTPEQDAALFAPFGDLDNKQRQAVVDVLDSSPQFADRIWQSGLAAASR